MLTFSIIAIIMSNAVNNRRDTTILYTRISILILIYSFFIFNNVFYYNYINKGIILLNGLLCIENYTVFFSLFIIFLSIIILSICSTYSLKNINLNYNYISNFFKLNISKKIDWKNRVYINSMSEHFRIIEYPLIILFCISGALFLMFSLDIISIFLSIELQSYALYLICSIYRNSESSTNAGLTYFLLGGLSSCIILLGLSLLYINSGNTNLENIYIINNISDIYVYSVLLYSVLDINNLENFNIYILDLISTSNYQHIYIQIALLIMSVGFLFKIASAPFHFWSPDVYDAVPTISTTFIAIIPKISILILLYKILFFTSSDIISLSWTNNLVLSSILSLIIGSVLGLTQYRIKRLYAYSTISHLGFLLIGLSINNIESTKAFFFYLLQYSISNLNAFFILISMGIIMRNYTTNNINVFKIKDINYSPIQLISQLKGFYFINPLLTVSLSLTLFSFAGIPPLIGFFGKQMILTAALNTNLFFIVFLAIITSVISAVYYLVIIKEMFFFKKNSNEKNNILINTEIKQNYLISSIFSLNISIITLLIIFFIFFDQEILRIINILL